MKRIANKDFDDKNGLVFTEEEFKLIESKSHKYWVMMNRENYNGRNFIYVYENNPAYFSYVLEIFKYDNNYVIDNVNGFHSYWQFDNINEVLEYIENYG